MKSLGGVPVFGLMFGLSFGAVAQTKPESVAKKEAARLTNEGNALLRAGEPAAALARYEAAHAQYPTAKIFFNMGQASRQLRRWVEAADYYERFLEESGVDAQSPHRTAARAELSRALKELATMAIAASPADATVRIDGELRGQIPAEPVRLLPGAHILAFERPGYVPKTLQVELPRGAQEELMVTLEPLPSDVVAAGGPAADESASESAPLTSQWWFWTLVAVGAAAVVGGTAVALDQTRGEFPLGGNLGRSSTRDWEPL